MRDAHRPLLQPWTGPQKALTLRRRVELMDMEYFFFFCSFLVWFIGTCVWMWALRANENHWFAIETCAARSTRDEISDCVPVLQAARAGRLKRVQLAWLSNGSLETVRNSGVPGSLYTKPRNRENAMSAQSIATGNPETVRLWTTEKNSVRSFL